MSKVWSIIRLISWPRPRLPFRICSMQKLAVRRLAVSWDPRLVRRLPWLRGHCRASFWSLSCSSPSNILGLWFQASGLRVRACESIRTPTSLYSPRSIFIASLRLRLEQGIEFSRLPGSSYSLPYCFPDPVESRQRDLSPLISYCFIAGRIHPIPAPSLDFIHMLLVCSLHSLLHFASLIYQKHIRALNIFFIFQVVHIRKLLRSCIYYFI